MHKINQLAITLAIGIGLSGCYKEEIVVSGDGLDDWTSTTHSAFATPNYDIVFPGDAVNRIDLVIDKDYWEIMLEYMEDNYGSFGSSSLSPQDISDDVTPIYVPCSFFFNNTEWYHVGVRFKGNSSLASAWGNGNMKLPLRFDFSYFEDEYPQIAGQTFYGFSELSCGSNYNDASVMREKVTADLFREAGVPAPHASYYRVYIDHGDGPIYFGLYTMIEVVFDTMLDKQFGSSNGNCYKPEDDGAKFGVNTFNTADFDNKTGGNNYSDVEALYTALHSANRTSNPTQWRSEMEAAMDMDGFCKWLAVNTTIQNWDTYGLMPHNYYLYTDPADGLIKWIPWDNNEALQEGKMGGALSFEFNEVSDEWPLINYVMSDATYRNTFDGYVNSVISSVFEPSKMQAQYQTEYNLIAPYVTGADGEQSGYTYVNSASDFNNALSELMSHVSERFTAADQYLN